MLYIAQLKERIEYEREQRDHLAMTYETSLTKGVQELSQETQILA